MIVEGTLGFISLLVFLSAVITIRNTPDRYQGRLYADDYASLSWKKWLEIKAVLLLNAGDDRAVRALCDQVEDNLKGVVGVPSHGLYDYHSKQHNWRLRVTQALARLQAISHLPAEDQASALISYLEDVRTT